MAMSHELDLDRIPENARTFGVSAQQELRRWMVHGLLRMLGHTDKSAAKRKAMSALEDQYLVRYWIERHSDPP